MTLSCRTCGNKIYNMNAKDLFMSENEEILTNIEIVAGTVLEKHPHFPRHICACCLLDLKKAIFHVKVFRDRCMKTQEQLLSTSTEEEPTDLEAYYSLRNETDFSPKELPVKKIDTDDHEEEVIHFSEEHIFTDPEEFYTEKLDDNADERTGRGPSGILDRSEYSSSTQNTSVEFQDILGNEVVSNRDRRESPCGTKTTNLTRKRLGTHRVKIKKKYISWKNLTEEQIIDRRRKQRRRDCICDQCGRHFTDQSNFKLHLLRHSGVKNFKCGECERLFYTEHLLQLHERTVHRGERPYACKYCEKAFNNSTTRVMHERSHTNVRPYSCEYCDKSFVSTSALKRHDLTHNGVRAFYCNVCDKTFQRNTHLKAHLRSKLHSLRESNITLLRELE